MGDKMPFSDLVEEITAAPAPSPKITETDLPFVDLSNPQNEFHYQQAIYFYTFPT